MNFSDYINIAAIILAPIVSVIVGQKLQDRARKRDDKMQVFQNPDVKPNLWMDKCKCGGLEPNRSSVC